MCKKVLGMSFVRTLTGSISERCVNSRVFSINDMEESCGGDLISVDMVAVMRVLRAIDGRAVCGRVRAKLDLATLQ